MRSLAKLVPCYLSQETTVYFLLCLRGRAHETRITYWRNKELSLTNSCPVRRLSDSRNCLLRISSCLYRLGRKIEMCVFHSHVENSKLLPVLISLYCIGRYGGTRAVYISVMMQSEKRRVSATVPYLSHFPSKAWQQFRVHKTHAKRVFVQFDVKCEEAKISLCQLFALQSCAAIALSLLRNQEEELYSGKRCHIFLAKGCQVFIPFCALGILTHFVS